MNTCPKCGLNEEHLKRMENAKKDFPNTEEINKLESFYKVIGDQTRLKILISLEYGGLCVSDIACLLNMSLSAVSHQLRVLKDANLVKATKNGKTVFYELDDYHIKEILEIGLEHIKEKH